MDILQVMNLKIKWKLYFDIKTLNIFFWIAIFALLLSYILVISTNIWDVDIYSNYTIRSNYFYFSDILLPVVFMFNIIVLFGDFLDKINGEFIFSLPIKMFDFYWFRILRIVIIFLIPYILFIGLLSIETELSFFKCLFLSIPNFIFLLGFPAFVITVTKRIFYSFIICCGYIFLDLTSMGYLFENKSLFINIFHAVYTDNEIIYNRLSFAVIGVLLIIISYIIMNLNIYKKSL